MDPGSSREALYYEGLRALKDAGVPMGAWRLAALLRQRGVDVSQATVGRMLWDMEARGHVVRRGRDGRAITEEGVRVLEDWDRRLLQIRSHQEFVSSLKFTRREELVDVLVARRAVESETAALAAARRTPEDLEILRGIVEAHEKLLEEGSSGVEKDVAFHRALARASKNPVLAAALDVIYNDPDIGMALEYIRRKRGSRMVEDHKNLLSYVERGDPEGARKAMTTHIDNVVRDVETYWDEVEKGRGNSGVQGS
ncbi:MAG: FCD domain-containing protein [Firmicutes bacterium]|nr:FCD domain-containing protein [Candidatus Fermentithermobacillaceae bacterium]